MTLLQPGKRSPDPAMSQVVPVQPGPTWRSTEATWAAARPRAEIRRAKVYMLLSWESGGFE